MSDLFKPAQSTPAPSPSTNKQNNPAARQWCSIKCTGCKDTLGANLGHYDLIKCKCGALYWALQPTRNGPLKLFPHPEPPPGVTAPGVWT